MAASKMRHSASLLRWMLEPGEDFAESFLNGVCQHLDLVGVSTLELLCAAAAAGTTEAHAWRTVVTAKHGGLKFTWGLDRARAWCDLEEMHRRILGNLRDGDGDGDKDAARAWKQVGARIALLLRRGLAEPLSTHETDGHVKVDASRLAEVFFSIRARARAALPTGVEWTWAPHVVPLTAGLDPTAERATVYVEFEMFTPEQGDRRKPGPGIFVSTEADLASDDIPDLRQGSGLSPPTVPELMVDAPVAWSLGFTSSGGAGFVHNGTRRGPRRARRVKEHGTVFEWRRVKLPATGDASESTETGAAEAAAAAAAAAALSAALGDGGGTGLLQLPSDAQQPGAPLPLPTRLRRCDRLPGSRGQPCRLGVLLKGRRVAFYFRESHRPRAKYMCTGFVATVPTSRTVMVGPHRVPLRRRVETLRVGVWLTETGSWAKGVKVSHVPPHWPQSSLRPGRDGSGEGVGGGGAAAAAAAPYLSWTPWQT